MVHLGVAWMFTSLYHDSCHLWDMYGNTTNVIFYVKCHQTFLEHSYKLFPGIIQDFAPLPITKGLFEVLNVHACYATYCFVLFVCIYAHGPLAYCIKINSIQFIIIIF